ncbi:MAG TPA: carbohydrate ABC transporter permease [Meiothermus sp.]|nr:carbohydrate ABC transporter permease [Meiothermus sp.]
MRTVESKQAGLERRQPGPRKSQRNQGLWISRIILIVASILYVTPIYWMITTAVKSPTELAVFPPTLIPGEWHWENFARSVEFIPFGRYLINTLIITFFSVVGSVISNLIVAYGFSRIQWRGRDLIFGLVVATIFVPFPVTVVPLFVIFAKLGWINTFLPLIVPTFFANPFYVFLLRQFLMQIPFEISESAKVDGASEWQVLWYLILPLARPAIAVVAIFAAIAAWNDFFGPLIYLQDESKYTLSIGLQMFRSTHQVQWSLMMAASTLVVLPVIVIFLAFQRSFIEGITLGSIK